MKTTPAHWRRHVTLEQQCTHNKVNEITNITAPSGQPHLPTPSYNAVGNTTSFPQPNDPTSSYDATYDAWNRLVKIVDGGNTVAEYVYDGRNFRIVKRTYDTGVLDETRHCYYSSGWQVLEEHVRSNASSSSSSSSSGGATGQTVNRQFVWGKRYIDDLICRNRDTTGNGVIDEQLWTLQDANFNVTCIVALAGEALERYEYDAYGRPEFLSDNWAQKTNSSYEFEVLFRCYLYEQRAGWYQVRHRVLHPVLGRWIQQDRLGLADGMNLY